MEEDRTTSLLPEEQMVHVYADVLVVRQESYLSHADSLQTIRRIDSVYESYHVRSGQIDTTLGNYKKNVTSWKHFHEKVAKRLETLGQMPLPKRRG